MAHDHGHDHTHAPHVTRGRLSAVLALTLAFLVVEVVAGILTGSLALLADAGHMLTDVAGLVLALLAMKLAERPASPRRTFGYHRAEVLAALTNGVLLLGVAGYILVEAWDRFREPRPVPSSTVLLVAGVGLLVNVAGALLLRSGAKTSLNLRGAYNEVVADALSSIGVIVGALVMGATGYYRVDTVVAVAIALFVLPRTWALLREAFHVLLEGTPREVDLAALRSDDGGRPGRQDGPRPPRLDPDLRRPRPLRSRHPQGGRAPRPGPRRPPHARDGRLPHHPRHRPAGRPLLRGACACMTSGVPDPVA